MSQDYFILNKETGKLELHFEKATYMALSEDQKSRIKGAFLWGRNSGCWISRSKWPSTSYAEKIAKDIGLEDAGETGERLSFADQMQQKADRAERRAERYENRADAAEARGEALQKPINDMHGDIAFFTQPNINTSAGRAFTNKRRRMFEAWEAGFAEFNKSAYWKDRAKTARETSEQKNLQDKAFVQRRIDERLSDIRKLKKNIEQYEGYQKAFENGEKPRGKYGYEVNITPEQVENSLDHWTDILEAKLDELGFYQDCMDNLGGVQFSKDNIKPGYIVEVRRRESVKVVSCGPKNFTGISNNWPLKYAYSEIVRVVSATEDAPEIHPFKVGEEKTIEILCRTGNGNGMKDYEWRKVTYRIVKATDKSVTLQADVEGAEPFIRKPIKSKWETDGKAKWYIDITGRDSYNQIWYKLAG